MVINGILNFYKPKGISSFRIVNEIKSILKVKKVGHTGTLDPNASGVLLICLGNATKISQFIMDFKKYYMGEMILGIETNSQDSEGKIVRKIDVEDSINRSKIDKIFKKYTGIINQTPPMFSASYYKGKRLYKLARKGIEVKRKPKKINIYQLSLLEFHPSKNPIIKFEVICSKGTYIRTLCSDIGKDLECGAYMAGLIRTRVGNYDVSESLTIEELKRNVDLANKKLIRIDKILSHFGQIKIKEKIESKILNGGFIFNEDILDLIEPIEKNYKNMFKVKNKNGKLLAISKKSEDNHEGIIFKPVKVFHTE